MKPRVIIPMKPLLASKSRLRGALPDEQRAALALGMLDHVLAVLKTIPETDVVVAGGDDAIRQVCELHGGRWRADDSRELNRCLDFEFSNGRREGADLLVFLPSDLPLVTRPDVQAILETGRSTGAVIVPDRHGTGTNGLLVRGDCAFQFRLGEGSFRGHTDSMTGLGITHSVLRLPGLELDLDTREDLVVLEQRSPGRAPQLAQAGASALARAAGSGVPSRAAS